jgi:hypothetical protein
LLLGSSVGSGEGALYWRCFSVPTYYYPPITRLSVWTRPPAQSDPLARPGVEVAFPLLPLGVPLAKSPSAAARSTPHSFFIFKSVCEKSCEISTGLMGSRCAAGFDRYWRSLRPALAGVKIWRFKALSERLALAEPRPVPQQAFPTALVRTRVRSQSARAHRRRRVKEQLASSAGGTQVRLPP